MIFVNEMKNLVNLYAGTSCPAGYNDDVRNLNCCAEGTVAPRSLNFKDTSAPVSGSSVV